MAKAKQSSKKSDKEVAELKAEVIRLQKIVDSNKTKKSARKFSWRGPVIWLGVALATALLVVGNIFFWTGNTIVNTDRYVAAVGPLIQKPEIQTAIAGYTTTQIFDNVDVQSYVQTALPPRAEFLAPQLTSQLKAQTESGINKLLVSPQVQSYWYSSLTRRHQALISFAQNYEGNGTIEISDIYSQLSKRLADTKLSFLANKQLPANVGSIKVVTVGWLPILHKVSNNIAVYQAVTTLLLLAILAGIIALASKRRKLVIQISIIFAIAMLLTLIAVRIAGSLIVAKVDPTYQSAVRVAYDTVLQAFRTQTIGLLLVSLLITIIAWVGGPYKSATAIRDRVTLLLSGKLHQAVFGKKENGLTRWVGKYKRPLQSIAIAIVALVMLVVQLSPRLVISYGLMILLIVLVIEFLAAPKLISSSGRKQR